MLNKKQFVAQVAKQQGKTKKEVLEAVDLVLEGIKNSLANDGGVKFIGFGSFTVLESKEHYGYDINNDEVAFYSAKRLPKFYPSNTLKDYIQ